MDYIDCIDQSVEIDDTLVSFIDLHRFYRFHRFVSEDTSEHLFIRTKMKTDFMQTVNLLTIESRRIKQFIMTLFKTWLKIFFWLPILAKFVGA